MLAIDLITARIMSAYHIPVLLEACIEGLAIQPSGVYVDVTFGSGAHSNAILERLSEKGRLHAFDQDWDALANTTQDSRLNVIHGNFRYLKKLLKLEGVIAIDGLLADLGVSSHQLDMPERGFSFRHEAELDMRMNVDQVITAKQILNSYDANQLQYLLSTYGEIRNARTLAQRIVQQRQQKDILTTGDLNSILEQSWMGNHNRYFAQVYQAIRIEVNEELKVIEDMLQGAAELLKPGGRLVIMSYHSLEDRIVKNFFKTGNVEGKVVKDDFGKIWTPFKLITRKPLEADPKEIQDNPRSRSAKLRIAEKI